MVRDDTIIFYYPEKTTLYELRKYEGMEREEVSKLLNVGRACFNDKVEKFGIQEIFKPYKTKDSEYFTNYHWVLIEEVKKCEGETLTNAAKILGIPYASFRKGTFVHDINHLFPRPGCTKDVETNKEEYGIDLIIHNIECYTKGCTNNVRVEAWPGVKPDKRRFCQHCHNFKAPSHYEEDAQLQRC